MQVRKLRLIIVLFTIFLLVPISVSAGDSDGDGSDDSEDAFPDDPTQWADSDGDGYGDNADGNWPDSCPMNFGASSIDRNGCPDTDGDGYSDPDESWPAHPEGNGDTFPQDSNEWADTDEDGFGDNTDVDDDEDGVLDSEDSCPLSSLGWTSTPSIDFDSDGCMDWEDLDDDGDGFLDSGDLCPNTPNGETVNSDGCSDSQLDSDGDGVDDETDAFPEDPSESQDTDGDGCGDNGDAFPDDPTQCSDSDGDGYGDNADGNWPDSCPMNFGDSWRDRKGCPDTDGDGYSDAGDAFPDDLTQWSDSDDDGFGDNPNGNVPDSCPMNFGASSIDRNGCPDTDGDGYSDAGDAFPQDSNEYADTDGDGIGDSVDQCTETPNWKIANSNGCSTSQLDSDNDGVNDETDAFPEDPSESQDTDGDGFGDNSDAYVTDASRSNSDLSSQVVYVFQGKATTLQYAGILLSCCGLGLTIILGIGRTAKSKSTDKQMKSLLSMIAKSNDNRQLLVVKNLIDKKYLDKKITGEQNTFLKQKITEFETIQDSITIQDSVPSIQPIVQHTITKNISYNIQDSVVTGDGNISEIILPDPSSTGVMKDGFEWLQHEGNNYYRPANQPNTQWHRWQG